MVEVVIKPTRYSKPIHDHQLVTLCGIMKLTPEQAAQRLGLSRNSVNEAITRIQRENPGLNLRGRKHRKLPPAPKQKPLTREQMKEAKQAVRDADATWIDTDNPLVMAQITLGKAFDRERMYFKGVPIRMADLMKEVNRVREAMGQPQDVRNPAWRYVPRASNPVKER